MATVLVILLVAIAASTSGQDAGDSCTTASGKPGTCTEIQKCPSVHNTFRTKTPVTCGFKGLSPVVCCPSTEGDSQPSTSPLSADVSPPTITFECGISRPRIIRRPLDSSRRRRSSSDASQEGAFRNKRFVVGGRDSKMDAWPWMALLGKRDRQETNWFCGGVLINEQWILTALHCFFDFTPDVVRLGEHDYNDDADGAAHQDFKVTEQVFYPDFTPPAVYHDLALLKLESKVTIKRSIMPVCLPWGAESKRNISGDMITLTGWGDTSFGGFPSSILQEVDLVAFTSAVCDRGYSALPHYADTWPQGIGEETLCVGDPNGGRDSCQGDSGGPLVSKDPRGRFVLAGIVSRGYGCGHEDYPGLYGNVRHPPHLSWIKMVAFSSS